VQKEKKSRAAGGLRGGPRGRGYRSLSEWKTKRSLLSTKTDKSENEVRQREQERISLSVQRKKGLVEKKPGETFDGRKVGIGESSHHDTGSQNAIERKLGGESHGGDGTKGSCSKKVLSARRSRAFP